MLKNLQELTSYQSLKFRTRNWIGIYDRSKGTYNTNSDIRLKTTLLKFSLCDYSDEYISAKGIITITGEGDNADTRHAVERNKGVISKNCAAFTNCKNNTEIDNNTEIFIKIFTILIKVKTKQYMFILLSKSFCIIK